ncbi:unnamed protein product [Arctia plantaginis]|uniref:RNase NYN domain-containing protein n=1 Tax=Arctia plantaginis TaxID=874455 RepID=A0A8S0ZW37_ARCPL|nr:unnamed protein product [Arctia plantaginis]
MGKPSSQQLSKKSNHSLNSNNSQRILSMSSQKMEVVRRKKHKKAKNKIKNLFEKLKRRSVSSLNTSQDVTVISLDRSDSNNTIIPVDTICDSTTHKRKIDLTSDEPAKRRRSDNSLIIIADEDTTTDNVPFNVSSPNRSNTHITCSTPISRRDSKTLQNMIINNFTKSNNNNASVNLNEEVINLTKEIHKDSYLTIDLTAESEVNKTNNTIIDVDKSLNDATQTSDCSFVSISNASLSMSGDSDITIIQNNRTKRKENDVKKFAKGISKLNSTEKGKLLELIAKNIFNGCKISKDVKANLNNMRFQTQATETVQDTFIKEVILGESKSRNSIGSNIYHPSKDDRNKKGLRMIVIDGSNVAMEHTKGSQFSVQGLKICIDYFVKRGHVVKAFVPRFRCKYGKSTDPRLLDHLERQGLVVYTPSREIQGRMCTPYDDRYIVQCAAEFDGVIVSGDNYRDLLKENPRWRFVIENRLLPFTWVNDMIMFPRDPLGRNGPTLEQFLRHPETS